MRSQTRAVEECAQRWGLRLGVPYNPSVYGVMTAQQIPAVLKIQIPHRECEHEAEALRRWNGNGAVRLLDEDPSRHALLLERCEPGEPLQALELLPEILPRLWIEAAAPFHSLRDEAALWATELPVLWERAGRPFETALLDDALGALESLPKSQGPQVLLHQDLHPGNVLSASREPWLVIDPKPLVGEREFSLAPIVRAPELGHSRDEVVKRLDTLSAALKLDRERARLWTIAQTLAWAFEDDRVLPDHINVARWLWRA